MKFLTSVLLLAFTVCGMAQQPVKTMTTDEAKLAAFQTQHALLVLKLQGITEFQQLLDTDDNIRTLTARIQEQAERAAAQRKNAETPASSAKPAK